MSTCGVQTELRAVPFDHPNAVGLIAAARAEIDARGAIANASAAEPRGVARRHIAAQVSGDGS